MLCVLISVHELSCESVLSRDSCESLVATVDEEHSSGVDCESEGCCRMLSVWEASVGVASFRVRSARSCDVEASEASSIREAGAGVGICSSIGSNCFDSLMDWTIFSRSMVGRCFSRLLLSVER